MTNDTNYYFLYYYTNYYHEWRVNTINDQRFVHNYYLLEIYLFIYLDFFKIHEINFRNKIWNLVCPNIWIIKKKTLKYYKKFKIKLLKVNFKMSDKLPMSGLKNKIKEGIKMSKTWWERIGLIYPQ